MAMHVSTLRRFHRIYDSSTDSFADTRPISAYWTFGASDKCLNEGTVTLVAGIINCTADLLVTVLPIPTIMQLRLPLRQRVGVVILLSLGFIITIAGVVRT
jgi:hypothetical protein